MNGIKSLNRTMVICFLAVYIVWGSTYLAIRYAIDSLPPWTLAGLRFLSAALLMSLISRWKKEAPLSRQERTIALVSGAFLITANGIVCVSEKWVSTGIVSVIVGAMPIWIMLMGWTFFGQARPTPQKLIGAFIGLSGIVLIAGGGFESNSGIWIVLSSSLFWAVGSLLQRKAPNVKSGFRFSMTQMLTGGALATLISIVTEKPWSFSWTSVTPGSWIALVYLIFFGSIIGFTAYAWLGRNVEPHLVSTYALVNPVIAVALGWVLLSEPVTPVFFGATVLVLLGLSLLMIQPRRLGKRQSVGA